MHDTDAKRTARYREDLQKYLLEPLAEPKETNGDHPNKEKKIDICSSELSAVHNELMQIAKDSSIWIRNFFLPS